MRGKSVGSMVAVSFMLAGSLFLFGCESSAPAADSTLVSLSKADARQQLESAIVDNYAFDATFSISFHERQDAARRCGTSNLLGTFVYFERCYILFISEQVTSYHRSQFGGQYVCAPRTDIV